MYGNINGYLDLSKNKIHKFDMVRDPAKYQIVPFIAVPFGRAWPNTTGNKLFSIVNLVKVVSDIDINGTDQDTSKEKLMSEGLLILHILIQAYPYDYDCNCDMLKYIDLLKSNVFRSAMVSFKCYYEDEPRYSILISANILQNLKC